MGYSTDLFVDQDIKPEFTCTICHEVFKSPQMLEPCEHVFCGTCIVRWGFNSKTCPIDRKPYQSYKSPPRIYMNLLNGLRLNCPFMERGCTHVMDLGNLADHDMRCKFNPENLKECKLGCGAIVAKIEVRSHSCVVFLRDKIIAKDDELRNKDKELKAKADKLKSKEKELAVVRLELLNSKLKHGKSNQGETVVQEEATSPPAPNDVTNGAAVSDLSTQSRSLRHAKRSRPTAAAPDPGPSPRQEPSGATATSSQVEADSRKPKTTSESQVEGAAATPSGVAVPPRRCQRLDDQRVLQLGELIKAELNREYPTNAAARKAAETRVANILNTSSIGICAAGIGYRWTAGIWKVGLAKTVPYRRLEEASKLATRRFEIHTHDLRVLIFAEPEQPDSDANSPNN